MKKRRFKFYPLILAVAFVIDIGRRFALGFEMRRVIVLEAVLFAVAGASLLWAAKHDRLHSLAVARIDTVLAIFFGLGSLRAGLWFAGLAVIWANLAVLLIGVLAALGYAAWRWLSGRAAAQFSNKSCLTE